MKLIKDKTYGGERPLYASHDLELEGVTIEAGESALKECKNIKAHKCRFEGKYPLWRTFGFKITDSVFKEGARAALWYSTDLEMENVLVEAPKMFREMDRLKLLHVKLTHAGETLWGCRDVELNDVEVEEGDYLMMHCHNVKVDGLKLNGNYSFQYTSNVEIHNSVLNTKDAFWETENVTVYDSEINGEYLGWHSRNLKLVRCRISGTQPLCYAENLILEDCSFAEDADLAFEYSTVKARIIGKVTSVKNPTSGKIEAEDFGAIILDENQRAPKDCKIVKTALVHQNA